MDLASEINQRINELKQLIQNLDEFAVNRGVEKVECLFDFIPDEILFMIFDYDVGLVATLINKRFTNVYMSWMTSKVKAMDIFKIQGWDEYIVESEIISKHALYKWIIFSPNLQLYSVGNDHYVVRIKKNDIEYKFNFVDNIMYTSKLTTTTEDTYGCFNIIETSTANKKYLNIKCMDGLYETCAHINIIKGSCYAIYVEEKLIISDGESYSILDKHDDDTVQFTLNGLYYAFPKQSHPKYKEIMKILMSDNSPYPIEIMSYIPM